MMSQTKNNDKEEEIEVLYNACYGGWVISEKAKNIYKLRKSENSTYYSRRNNPTLIQIFKELGDEFNGTKYCKTALVKIPKIYENYYIISEYDGLETVEIDYTKYELDTLKQKIKEILENDNIDNNGKIKKLKEIII